MNTKLLVAASALMLALSATPALGYTGSRDVVLPGGWNDAFTGGASLAFCERVSDDATLSGVSPIYCERSGFGAIFSDVGCSADFYPPASPAILFGNGKPDNAAGCLDDLSGSPATDFGSDTDGKDDFATGTVHVKASAQVAGNEASWLVGNDRDDDGSVTATDTDGSSDGTQEGVSPAADCDQNNDGTDDPALAGCFDDEFIFGTDDVNLGFTTPTFCFTHDRDHAGGDWDDVVVFFSANLPPTTIGSDAPFVGTAKTDLSASSTNTACTRSGHGDNVGAFGGNPFNPAPLPIDLPLTVGCAEVLIPGSDPVNVVGKDIYVTCSGDHDALIDLDPGVDTGVLVTQNCIGAIGGLPVAYAVHGAIFTGVGTLTVTASCGGGAVTSCTVTSPGIPPVCVNFAVSNAVGKFQCKITTTGAISYAAGCWDP